MNWEVVHATCSKSSEFVPYLYLRNGLYKSYRLRMAHQHHLVLIVCADQSPLTSVMKHFFSLSIYLKGSSDAHFPQVDMIL